MRVVLTMLAFCLALPLLTAGPVFAECDEVPDQLQIKGGDGADQDQEPDMLQIRENQDADAVATAEAIGDQEPDRLQIRGGEDADHEGPDRLREGQTTE